MMEKNYDCWNEFMLIYPQIGRLQVFCCCVSVCLVASLQRSHQTHPFPISIRINIDIFLIKLCLITVCDRLKSFQPNHGLIFSLFYFARDDRRKKNQTQGILILNQKENAYHQFQSKQIRKEKQNKLFDFDFHLVKRLAALLLAPRILYPIFSSLHRPSHKVCLTASKHNLFDTRKKKMPKSICKWWNNKHSYQMKILWTNSNKQFFEYMSQF